MELTKEVRIQLIQNEIAGNVQARYVLELRHRINKKLGNTEANEAIEKDLFKVEATIDELSKALAEIEEVNEKSKKV